MSKRAGKGQMLRQHSFNAQNNDTTQMTNAQYGRDWGGGTSIVAKGDKGRRTTLEVLRARESLKSLRLSVRAFERSLKNDPGNVFLSQELEKAKGKLEAAEAVVAGGSPENK